MMMKLLRSTFRKETTSKDVVSRRKEAEQRKRQELRRSKYELRRMFL